MNHHTFNDGMTEMQMNMVMLTIIGILVEERVWQKNG